MKKIGLVLEGGGTRAIYTSGVLDYFLEKDLKFPYIIGVSAGSCNGISYIGKNLRRQHDITIDYVNDERYMSVKSMLKNGEYLNIPWIFGELSYQLSPLNMEEFENSDTKLVAVVTNGDTCKAEYFDVDDVHDECPVLAASCALPLATKGVQIGETTYFDGGITDSIPFKHAIEVDGCDKVIVILTQHVGYKKTQIKGGDFLKKAMAKKYPLISDGILERHNMYNAQLQDLAEYQKQGRAFVIQPQEPLGAGTLEKNTEKLEEIYQRGYNDAEKLYNQVVEFMNE